MFIESCKATSIRVCSYFLFVVVSADTFAVTAFDVLSSKNMIFENA